MMTLSKTFAEFSAVSKTCNVIPLFAETVADDVTPVSVYNALCAKEGYAFLLESVEGGERFGRYTFVGRRPAVVFTSQHGHVCWIRKKKTSKQSTTNPLTDLKTFFADLRPYDEPRLPRFWGGAVGYFDYDTVRYFERLAPEKKDSLGIPQAAFQIGGDLVIFDRLKQTIQVVHVVMLSPEEQQNPKRLKTVYLSAQKAIQDQLKRIHTAKPMPRMRKSSSRAVDPKGMTSREDYLSMVEQAKEHIRAGDIIQVVLSQRWEIPQRLEAFQVYRALRLVNPSPYMYFVHFPDFDIVGSSPEILVRKEGDLAETRPIAGTRPRGHNADEDARLAKELLADPKERAEHLMLVDLGRNDLGRVCQPRSVQVPELMVVENYSHVMHLVSSVCGTLAKNTNAFDLFQASFPAGTVSGAPKIRAMQIIDKLEPIKRSFYAGATGYFSFTGNMDMAITIRTLLIKNRKIYLHAGAGIVADSVPEKEFQECRHKAAALVAALEKAEGLLS